MTDKDGIELIYVYVYQEFEECKSCGSLAGVSYYISKGSHYDKSKMDGMYCYHCHLTKLDEV